MSVQGGSDSRFAGGTGDLAAVAGWEKRRDEPDCEGDWEQPARECVGMTMAGLGKEREWQSSSSRSQERLICIATQRDGRGEKKASEQGEKEGEEGVLVEKEEERREEGEEVEIQRERERDDGGSWASVTQSAHRADYIFLAFLVWIARVSP